MVHQLDPVVLEFLDHLAADENFDGEISTSLSDRVVTSTDNSIFEIRPAGVIACRHEKDIVAVLQLMAEDRFHSVTLVPRGGGTSTNGQSLGSGLVLDTSKYMTQILDVGQGYARMQCGVVCDDLNRRLREDGQMFGPSTSSSSRVTIGGMINTDASGIGSMVWGKTSDHILSLRLVLIGGEVITITTDIQGTEHPSLKSLVQVIKRVQESFYERIPRLPRFFSGYNLLCAASSGDLLNLVKLVAGSEGTLGVVSECTVNTVPIATEQTLFALLAKDMDSCLQIADQIRDLSPYAMEMIDEHILSSAKRDHSLREGGVSERFFTVAQKYPLGCALFVNFQNHGASQPYRQSISQLQSLLAEGDRSAVWQSCVYDVCTSDAREMDSYWSIRKKSVGLYGRHTVQQGRRHHPSRLIKSAAFIEDCAVHPRDVSQFIGQLRSRLDDHNILYGMYGHLDAGCVHIRPQVDYHDPQLRNLVQSLSDEVFHLVSQYRGVLWGEHGKGYRCEYLREFLGEDLYLAFCEIKQIFDPKYQLNRGKICPPTSHVNPEPLMVDYPLRADTDIQIDKDLRDFLPTALDCDGNGMCFADDSLMCPSYQATRSRVHSPKGRAALLRSWIHMCSGDGSHMRDLKQAIHAQKNKWLLSLSEWKRFVLHRAQQLISVVLQKNDGIGSFHGEVYAAYEGCLSCKGCTRGCPLHVDIPELKSRFLYLYHLHQPRPLRDYGFGCAESVLAWIASSRWRMALYHKVIHRFSKPLAQLMAVTELPHLHKFSQQKIQKHQDYDVMIVPDLMSAVMSPLYSHAITVLKGLGQSVGEVGYLPTGKSWHSLGFRRHFFRTSTRRLRTMTELFRQYPRTRFMSLDPGMGLVYRQEYAQLGLDSSLTVRLPQEVLSQIHISHYEAIKAQLVVDPKPKVYILTHCFEQSALADPARLWIEVFGRLGITVIEKSVGCCGMAGFWGYQQSNKALSEQIFARSWQPVLDSIDEGVVLVTGGSCRHQITRLVPIQKNYEFIHPLEYLAQLISSCSLS